MTTTTTDPFSSHRATSTRHTQQTSASFVYRSAPASNPADSRVRTAASTQGIDTRIQEVTRRVGQFSVSRVSNQGLGD